MENRLSHIDKATKVDNEDYIVVINATDGSVKKAAAGLVKSTGGTVLTKDSIDTEKIQDSAVTTPKVADKAITEGKLSDAVNAKIADKGTADGSISTQKLADSAVTTSKVGSGAITEAKLATALVTKINTAPVIGTDSVGTTAIQSKAVTKEKLATDIVDTLDKVGSTDTLKGDWGPKDVAVLIVAGQSNAHGHGTTLGSDAYTTPLENVYTLTKANNPLTKTDGVIWTKHQTNQNNNLGEDVGNLAGLGNLFAKKWQDNKTSKNLPDLYLIQVSTGGRAVAKSSYGSAAQRGWAPEDSNQLFDKAKKNITLAIKDLLSKDFNPRIIGFHWNQWEGDADRTTNTSNGYACQHFERNLLKILNSMIDWVETEDVPIWLYYPRSTVYDSVTSGVSGKKPRELIETAVLNIQKNRPNTYLMDALKAPGATTIGPSYNVFQSDNVHYKKSTHQWFSDEQYKLTVTNKKIGAVIRYPYNEFTSYGSGEVQSLKATIAALESRVIILDSGDKEMVLGKRRGSTDALVGLWEDTTTKSPKTGIINTNFAIFDSPTKSKEIDQLKELTFTADGTRHTLYIIGLHTKDTGVKENDFIIGNKVEAYYDSTTGSIKAIWKEGRAREGSTKYAYSYNDIIARTPATLPDTTTPLNTVLDWSTITRRKTEALGRFTTLSEFKLANEAEGVYDFNIGGNIFKAKALASGWVTIMVGYGGTASGIAPLTNHLDATSSGILSQAAIGALDIGAVKVYYKDGDTTTIDVGSTNAELIQRVKSFKSLQHRQSLNTINDSWTGTGANYLTANATGDLTAVDDFLDRMVFATEGNGNGFHWIPFRGNYRVSWNLGEIASNRYFSLLVRA